MRAFWITGFIFAALAAADDTGVPPRPKPADYPVQATAKTTVLAAMILPPEQVRRVLTPEINKGYVVVELAGYPEDGHSFDVNLLDFSLKIGNQIIHADKPRDVSMLWPEQKTSIGNRGPAVTTETGVLVAHGPNPVTGRPQTSTGTWESVGVSNEPAGRNPDPPARKPDQSAAEARIRDRALPEGETRQPVAGYLYFPQYGKKLKAPASLNYSKDEVSVDLAFPK